MKKLNRLAISLLSGVLSFVTLPAVCMDARVVELEASVNRAQTRVNEFAALHPDSVSSVIVMGEIGAGKTSLHHFLANRALTVQQHGRVMRLDAPDPLPGFRISHTAERGTSEPCMWYDAQNRLKFFDFPGNNDPEPEKIIINAVYANALIQNQARAKIVFAIAETDFDEPRYSTLSDRLGKLVDMFESMEQLQQGINVVITKHTNFPETIFQEVLEAAQGDNLNHINHNRDGKVLSLVRFLAGHGATRISFFPKPTEVGVYNQAAQRDRIFRNLRAEGNLIVNPRVRIAVTPQVRELVRDVGIRLNASLANLIRAEEAQLVRNYCLQRIANLAPNTITALRTDLGAIATNLEGIVQQANPNNPLGFANSLQVLLHADPLTARINTLRFLKSINPAVTYDTQAWAGALAAPIQQVRAVSAAPAANAQGLLPSYDFGNGTLTLRGTLLGTSDVNRAVAQLRASGNNQPIHQLKVYSYNTLLLDENLVLPGTLTSLMSPVMRVVGASRVINLSGAHGVHGEPGGPGLPGLPGGHGQHGGHFYGMANVYTNVNALSVNTIGGNGGNGSRGANGANGTDGVDANLNNLSQWIQNWNCKAPTYQGEHKYYNNPAVSQGTPGENSKQGGKGGLAGNNGTVRLEQQWNNVVQNAVAVSGVDGQAGTPGTGGIHGKPSQGHVENYMTRKKQGRNWKQQPPKVHVEHILVDRGRAPNGVAPAGVNAAEQTPQTAQLPLDHQVLREDYTVYYNAQVGVNPFVGAFPNL